MVAASAMGVDLGKCNHAVINLTSASAPDDFTAVAAVTGARIRVLGLVLTVGVADATIAFESGAGGTELASFYFDWSVQNQLILPYSQVGWFEAALSTLLNITISADLTTVDGVIVYDLPDH
jgi:hypothetical protein